MNGMRPATEKKVKLTEAIEKRVEEPLEEKPVIDLPATARERRLLYEALQPIVQRDADLISVGKNPDEYA